MTLAELKDKNIFLMNPGKIQKDFEYIFSDLHICGYLDKGQHINKNKDDFIIICDIKDNTKEEYEHLLLNANFEFAYAEDLFDELDFDLKKICGNRELVFCSDNSETAVPADIWGVTIMISSAELSKCNRTKHYVIYAGNSANKIPVLKSLGYKEIEDFIELDYLRLVIKYKPSELLKKTMYAPEIDQKNCEYLFSLLM